MPLLYESLNYTYICSKQTSAFFSTKMKRHRGIYLTLSLAVLAGGVCGLSLIKSCQDKTDIVDEWLGKQIFFPKRCYFSSFLTDSVSVDVENGSNYKILVYADSLGCLSCKLQLKEWKLFMEETDTLPVSVQYLFFIHPMYEQDLLQSLLMADFDYPICYDRADSLNMLNRFCTDSNLRTMLLDGNNKVVLVGNPVNNENIRNLYMSVLKGNIDTYE